MSLFLLGLEHYNFEIFAVTPFSPDALGHLRVWVLSIF